MCHLSSICCGSNDPAYKAFDCVGQCAACYCYQRAMDLTDTKPNYPVPAIPLQVVWPDKMNYVGYADMIYIDSLQYGEDDPQMVCAWDFWQGGNAIAGGTGKYTRMY